MLMCLADYKLTAFPGCRRPRYRCNACNALAYRYGTRWRASRRRFNAIFEISARTL
jgi:hypothetical protein